MTGKVFRSLSSLVVALGCVVAFATSAAAQTHDQPHSQPPSLAGTWNMSLIGDHVIPVALVLEQNGTALKATFIMMGKDYPFTGELKGTAFTLTGKGPAFGRPGGDHAAGAAAAAAPPANGPQRASPSGALAETTINGTTNPDGGLAGEMLVKVDDKTGKIAWTAERLKERQVPTQAAASTDKVDMTGKWTLSVIEAQLQMVMDVKQTGNKLTGTTTSDHLGTMTVEGTLANGVLKFSTSGSGSGQEVRIDYTGKFKADGTFAGDLTSPMGAMTWTLAAVKK